MTEHAGGGNHPLVILTGHTQQGQGFARKEFSAELPPAAAGRWCSIRLSFESAGPWWAKLEMADSARDQIVREAFFPPQRRGAPSRRAMLMHVPFAAGRMTLSLFVSRESADETPIVSVHMLGRASATLQLFAGGWRSLAAALGGSPVGLLGRARTLLGQSAARRGEAPPYRVWVDLFDTWGQQEQQALLSLPLSAEIEVAVVANGDDMALARCQAAIAAQWRPPCGLRVIHAPADWRALLGVWVVIIDAGECLAPHALACLSLAVEDDASTNAVCADVDDCDTRGQRSKPAFRPPPDPFLLRSALFAHGAWMFRRAAILQDWAALPLDACRARLALLRTLPAVQTRHVPLILTHCVATHFAQALARPVLPPPAREAWPAVSILVPSACRSRHVLRCLQKVANRTEYANFEILVVVSAIKKTDRRQAAIMRRLRALPHVRLIELDMPDFNFAAVINQAALQASGSLLLLQNDDVAPIRPDWLTGLVAFTKGENDARADIVGARLLYGNGLVQHAGVIMGLANLCEHGFRLARRCDPGPQGLARLTRRVCAVTAACLLVRRDLFESLGGLDEGFAIALNDVDFCLRAGEQGAVIVLAAGVEMYHFESLSLGKHYQGARAGLEAREVHRLRDRWAPQIMADPFYHPCASLEMGREFHPGFPPRQTPLSWIEQEAQARH
jgi:GT2 family glycosyltransferase